MFVNVIFLSYCSSDSQHFASSSQYLYLFFTFCLFIVELIDFRSNQTHYLTLNISLKPSGRHFKKMILPPQSVEA